MSRQRRNERRRERREQMRQNLIDQQKRWYTPINNFLRFYVWPPIFILLCPPLAMWIVKQGMISSTVFRWEWFMGNTFSWTVVLVFLFSSWMFLQITYRRYEVTYIEPLAPQAVHYDDDGVFYYIATSILFIFVHDEFPSLSLGIYINMPYILGSLNIVAFILSFYLLTVSTRGGEPDRSSPLLYRFYAGTEVHPALPRDTDVKQWIHSRVAMMGWQILILAFIKTSMILNKGRIWDPGFCANVLLQIFYIAKFFLLEKAYFNTPGVKHDRTGFLSCWGSLVWIPAVYTFSSFYLVAHPCSLDWFIATGIFALGLDGIVISLLADLEKLAFRNTREGQVCMIDGRPATFLAVENTHRPQLTLLTTGYWARARHVNYFGEIVTALFWCAPTIWKEFNYYTLVYITYLFLLIMYHIYRNERDCAAKYGSIWTEYCILVPYLLFPRVI